MRSRKSKRKNKPLSKVLIIFGKGITATLSIEMVMLFLRSGFSVYPVLADGSENWIAPETLKQITGRAPLSSSFSPAWQQKKHDFSVAIFINPAEEKVKSICSGDLTECDTGSIYKYVVDSCDNLFIALGDNCLSEMSVFSPSFSSSLYSLNKRILMFKLPLTVEHVAKAMESLFADVIRFLLFKSKLKDFTFKILPAKQTSLANVSDNTSDWLIDLSNELLKRSLTPVDEVQADLLVEAHNDSNIDLNTATNIDLNIENEKTTLLKLKFVDSALSDDKIVPLVKENFIIFKLISFGSIQIYDVTGTRLFPNVSGQTSIGRLADYLIDRLQVLATNDKLQV